MCWGWGEESKTSRGCHGRSGGPGAGRLTQAQVEVGDPQPRWKKTLRAPEEGSGPRRHRAGLLLPFSPWPTSHVCFGPLLPFPTHLLSSLGLHWDPSFQETFLLLSQHRHPGGPCWELWEGREGLSIFPVSGSARSGSWVSRSAAHWERSARSSPRSGYRLLSLGAPPLGSGERLAGAGSRGG